MLYVYNVICCIRTSGVSEKCFKVVQDMYESCKTMVRCAVDVTELQGGGGTASRIGSEPLVCQVMAYR